MYDALVRRKFTKEHLPDVAKFIREMRKELDNDSTEDVIRDFDNLAYNARLIVEELEKQQRETRKR